VRNHVSVVNSIVNSTCYIFHVVNINEKGPNEIFCLFKDMMLSIWVNSLLLRTFTSACLLWVRCCETSCRPVYFDYFHLWYESLQRPTSKNNCFFQTNKSGRSKSDKLSDFTDMRRKFEHCNQFTCSNSCRISDHVFVVTCIRGGSRWVVYIWSSIDLENVSNVRIRTVEIALDL